MYSDEMVSQGIVVQFSEGTRDFPRLQTAQTISGARLTSYPVGTRRNFPEGRAMWNFM